MGYWEWKHLNMTARLPGVWVNRGCCLCSPPLKAPSFHCTLGKSLCSWQTDAQVLPCGGYRLVHHVPWLPSCGRESMRLWSVPGRHQEDPFDYKQLTKSTRRWWSRPKLLPHTASQSPFLCLTKNSLIPASYLASCKSYALGIICKSHISLLSKWYMYMI